MNSEKIIVGAGCFWGVQHYFDQVPGVLETVVGYSGGHVEDPGYEQVCSGTTGHAEVVEVTYDPDLVSLEGLLKHFFYMHDPTQLNRQGPDVGEQYRSAIFYYDESQKAVIESIIGQTQDRFDKPIVTEVRPAEALYSAEEYHQKFTEKTGRGGCHVSYKPQS
ncbi:peptide-methionine (S)-S-oxide reductase MsrA [soil metagenome]